MTAHERRRIKKELQNREEFEKLREAMMQGASDTIKAKQRKYDEFHSSYGGTKQGKHTGVNP